MALDDAFERLTELGDWECGVVGEQIKGSIVWTDDVVGHDVEWFAMATGSTVREWADKLLANIDTGNISAPYAETDAQMRQLVAAWKEARG